jgi:GH24 family phage-related lysozyme (muramidase)
VCPFWAPNASPTCHSGRRSLIAFHFTPAREAGFERAIVAAIVGQEVGNITDDLCRGAATTGGHHRPHWARPYTSAITEAEACALVKRDLTASNITVSSVCHVPLTADERAALDDFVYNLGAGNFRSSTLLKLLNAGDYAGAASQFDLWDHAGGVVLAGLLRLSAG